MLSCVLYLILFSFFLFFFLSPSFSSENYYCPFIDSSAGRGSLGALNSLSDTENIEGNSILKRLPVPNKLNCTNCCLSEGLAKFMLRVITLSYSSTVFRVTVSRLLVLTVAGKCYLSVTCYFPSFFFFFFFFNCFFSVCLGFAFIFFFFFLYVQSFTEEMLYGNRFDHRNPSPLSAMKRGIFFFHNNS